jgi:hypothetical protein
MIKDYNNGPNEWATEASAATSKIDFMGLTYAGRKSAACPRKQHPTASTKMPPQPPKTVTTPHHCL